MCASSRIPCALRCTHASCDPDAGYQGQKNHRRQKENIIGSQHEGLLINQSVHKGQALLRTHAQRPATSVLLTKSGSLMAFLLAIGTNRNAVDISNMHAIAGHKKSIKTVFCTRSLTPTVLLPPNTFTPFYGHPIVNASARRTAEFAPFGCIS